MSAAQKPIDQQRKTARFAGIELNNLLAFPDVTTDEAHRKVTTEVPDEPTIHQILGDDPLSLTVTGVCYLPRANAFDRLVRGGPFTVRTPPYDGWALCRSVSTNPYKWRPARGVWGYQYRLDLVATPKLPEAQRVPLPTGTNVPASVGIPQPRQRVSTEIAGVELPPLLRWPNASIDSQATINEHDVVGASSVCRFGGAGETTISLEGETYHHNAIELRDSITEGDEIRIRSDRYRGKATASSITTDPTGRFYPGHKRNPSRTYKIELTDVGST